MNTFNEFIDYVYSIKDRAILEDFLIGITTEKERTELIKRVCVIKQLIDGESQHNIASNLGVGVATVTRGSKELSNGRFISMRKS